MNPKIATYTLTHHKSLFSDVDSKKEYFFIQAKEHPYISEPYRAESYAIEFLRIGSIIMQTQLEQVVVHAPAIIALSPAIIRSFSKHSEEILLDIIFFKPHFFLENQTNVFFLSQHDFFENKNVFQLEDRAKTKFEKIFALIGETLESNCEHQAAILRSYLYVLIYELDALKDFNRKELGQNYLFEKFKEILFKDFTKQRSVDYYANSLNVTRKYLSEVIKVNSGKTARNWIDDFVMLEAKILLQNKALTVNHISEILNFSNQSAFGRFFKIHAAVSPLEYRKMG